jgi:hypothetical protein
VQRVRHDRGGEYTGRELRHFYEERGIQREATAGFSPESNVLAERHNLTFLDMTRPMLVDSGDKRLGLEPLGEPLGERYAGYAIMYANDLHNATPASGAHFGRTPHEGLWGRQVCLGAFRRFGCRVWVHTPGKPSAYRRKFAHCGEPGRFHGFERPFGSGVYLVLLSCGKIVQSQSVIFADDPYVSPPPPPSLEALDGLVHGRVAPLVSSSPPAGTTGQDESDSEDDGEPGEQVEPAQQHAPPEPMAPAVELPAVMSPAAPSVQAEIPAERPMPKNGKTRSLLSWHRAWNTGGGRSVICLLANMHYQVISCWRERGMEDTRLDWWQVAIGRRMEWTIRKRLHQCAPIAHCACYWQSVHMKDFNYGNSTFEPHSSTATLMKRST